MWCGAIWMWKYTSFKSTDTTSPWGESAPGSVPAKSYQADAYRALCWWAWDVVSGGVLHLSWAPQNSSWKGCTPACSLGVVLSLLSQAICITLVIESVHSEAMLETAPRRWNRVVEAGRTHALMQSNQREILGIVFHTLRNWHSGLLVVGITGECCAAITRVGSGSVPFWGGASCVVLTEWGGKSSFAQMYAF